MPERFDPQGYIQKAFDFETPPLTAEEWRRHRLRESIAAYVDLQQIRQYAAEGIDLRLALRYGEGLPEEVTTLFETLKVLLTPAPAEQIKSPGDIAALLMVDMGFLLQEQMKIACLDTRNRLQKLHMVYQGNVNTSMVRIAELFREPIKLNSAAVIIAHNHPSSDPMPSPEDVLVTREIVAAGELLDIEVLDHLVIGQGRWVSLRERGLGFTR